MSIAKNMGFLVNAVKLFYTIPQLMRRKFLLMHKAHIFIFYFFKPNSTKFAWEGGGERDPKRNENKKSN